MLHYLIDLKLKLLGANRVTSERFASVSVDFFRKLTNKIFLIFRKSKRCTAHFHGIENVGTAKTFSKRTVLPSERIMNSFVRGRGAKRTLWNKTRFNSAGYCLLVSNFPLAWRNLPVIQWRIITPFALTSWLPVNRGAVQCVASLRFVAIFFCGNDESLVCFLPKGEMI